eukprot:2938121-Pyramimonas_sp.AAC.1
MLIARIDLNEQEKEKESDSRKYLLSQLNPFTLGVTISFILGYLCRAMPSKLSTKRERKKNWHLEKTSERRSERTVQRVQPTVLCDENCN